MLDFNDPTRTGISKLISLLALCNYLSFTGECVEQLVILPIKRRKRANKHKRAACRDADFIKLTPVSVCLFET